MHFFGLWGYVMFFIGFIAAVILGCSKLYAMSKGIAHPLVTSSPYFFIAMTMMILGTNFSCGISGEIIHSSSERNNYKVEEEL